MSICTTRLTLCYKAEIKEYPNGTRTNMDIKAYQKAYREKHKKKPVYTFSVNRRPAEELNRKSILIDRNEIPT